MMTALGWVALLAVLALVILILRQPNEFRVSRSITISAAPEIIFDYVNTSKKWELWSPWQRMEPDAKMTYSGPDAGVGAVTRWAGQKTGEGTSTIIESRPFSYVAFRMDFLKPFKATNTADFTLSPSGSDTVVTWSMYGPNNFMGKAMGLIIDCNKMLGDQFSNGLENLRAVVTNRSL
jgi:hypothetical protein